MTGFAALQRVSWIAGSRAQPRKSMHWQAFARISVQTGGGNVHKRVPPPYFSDDLARCTLSLRDSSAQNPVCAHITRGESGR